MNLNFHACKLNSSICVWITLFFRLLEGLIGVSVLENFEERCKTKNYHPVSLLYVVSKVFEKLANNRFVDHLEKYVIFSDFQYSLRSSQSTSDLLKVVSIDLLINLGLLELEHLIYPRLSTGFDMLVFFPNLSLMKFWVR